MPINTNSIKNASDLFTTGANATINLFLAEFFASKIKDLKREAGKHSATGNLEESIELEVKGRDATTTISMADYYDFQNEGVDGTERKWGSPYRFKNDHPSKAMVKSMIDSGWGQSKGLGSSPGGLEAALYGVSVSVKRKGIKPTGFFDKVINDKTINELNEAFAKEFGKAIQLTLFK